MDPDLMRMIVALQRDVERLKLVEYPTGVTFPIVTSNPVSPIVGQGWILQSGGVGGVWPGQPWIPTVTTPVTYTLSVYTATGIKTVALS